MSHYDQGRCPMVVCASRATSAHTVSLACKMFLRPGIPGARTPCLHCQVSATGQSLLPLASFVALPSGICNTNDEANAP